MDVPISKIDVEYLIDAAKAISTDDDIPKYISYRLFKEAQQRLLIFGDDVNAARLHERICQGFGDLKLRCVDVSGGPVPNYTDDEECPEKYENWSLIQILVDIYREYYYAKNENDGVEGSSETREKFLTTSKLLRTALKMLIRVERGDTSEEDFIRENGIPKEFVQDTEYDEGSNDTYNIIESSSTAAATDLQASCVNWTEQLNAPLEEIDPEIADTIELEKDRQRKANMDVPISKTDIEYLIDAAENTTVGYYIPQYLPYRLLRKAQELLENQGPTENIEDLKSRICKGLERLKKNQRCPKEYKEMSLIEILVDIYGKYDKKGKQIDNSSNDELREEDKKHKKWGTLSANFQKFEARSAMREEILATYKAMRTALKMLCRVERGKTSEDDFIRENEIPKEFLQDTEYDEDVTYNIIPFDGPDMLPEVKYAIESLKCDIEAESSPTRVHDVLDCLQKYFGFQESSVSNQRENIVILLSNELMRRFTPGEHGTAIDKALDSVFEKTLGNYIEWCNYLRIKPIWKNMDDENRKKKRILCISLYYLIWGEAANVRFLPECLCYIFHHMGERLGDEYFILVCEQLDVQHVSGSFIDQVIQPLYEVISAEAKINKNRDTSHSKWRNYDDFNEYFWSKDCFQLGWPLNTNSPFFQKPPEGSTTVFGKTSFVERRTFLHLYHSFHRMWIFHVMMFEALVIFAFNDGELNLKTLTETLTVTYFLMKLIQSILDIWLKYGAYSNTSCVDVLRILAHFFWSMLATLIMCFPRMKCLHEKTSSIEESIGFKKFITVLGIYAVNFWKCFQEKTSSIEELIGFKNYIIVLGVYAFSKISFSISYQFLPQIYENSFVASLIKWINQEEYVGRGMGEKRTDIFQYMLFWIFTLGINVALTNYGLTRPLVRATRDITDVSKNIHNMLAIGSLWAGVICAYIVGSHVVYNVASAVVGTFVGHWDGLGKIKSLGDVHKRFNEIPTAFMDHLHTPLKIRESPLENDQEDVKKLEAAEFSPFWNQIVMHLREEDYISDSEQYALNMPENSGSIDAIHWPPFLLFGKVFRAIRLLQIAQQHTQFRLREVWERVLQRPQHTQKDLWNEISRDDVYMKYAVEECFHSVKFILHSVLKDGGKKWVEGIYEDIESSIARDGNLCPEFQLNKLESFVKAISELTEILNIQEDADNRLIYSAEQALQNVIRHDFLGKKRFAWLNISVIWPTNPELRSQIERLHLLLTMDKSEDQFPRNREARRRLEFFINSLFMSIQKTMPVCKMLSFSVLTPYYEETVLYSLDKLESSNDGVTLIDYLGNRYPDEWDNFCERMEKRDTHDGKVLELRLWASYRGQTLARTVRGTMYYQKALLFQAYRETLIGSGVDGLTSTSPVPDVCMDEDTDGISSVNVTEHVSIKLLNKDHYREWVSQMEKFLQAKGMFGYINGKLKDPDPKGKSHLKSVMIYSQRWKELDGQVKEWIRVSLSESMYDAVKDSETAKQMWDALKEIIGSQCLDYAKAHVDLKFTYVVSCQIYGEQKSEGKDVAADIAFLLKKNEGLRVAYIDGNVENNKKEFYSKLVKADKNGKEMEVYSIKLPGDPILGEGKPENQNHAIVFTRGNAIQTIDMNQDNYFEETLKMRNLLEEFHRKDGIHPSTILGIREHIFTGSASSLASFMSNQETGFVTLGQRVIAKPLKVRMHYGHPDVFDRVFHITRGGISKASRGINISEDIYAGFNSTLRQGSVTHHEYIQVGKGRDVGFNQIATFEGKVAGGNGEQVLSRDLYRLGQRFDFFRMLSFYYTTVGYYFSSLLMVITLYILLYGNLIMALSGTRVRHALKDTDMAPEWLLLIVLLPAIYMLLVPYLEQGLEKAVENFLAMFFSLGSIFFAFSLGTRIHWFGRTIIHGGASYQATGRGFVLHHIKFSENYRRYSRSHFIKGMEMLFLLVVYCKYGFHSVRAIYNNLLLLGGLILSISWIVAPFLFDSSPFDRYIKWEDWDDWNNWRNCKSVPVEESHPVEEGVAIEEHFPVEETVPVKKSVPVDKSWEAWWNKELDHIRTPAGRVIETILSLRFFIFPLVVGYKLDVQGLGKSFSNCVIPWICLVVILFFYEVFYKKKQMIQFFSYNRMLIIVVLAIAYYTSAFGDMLTFTIAIITTILGFILFFDSRVASIGALAIAYYYSDLGWMLAFIMAIITTIWGFISFFNSRVVTIGALAIACYYSDFGGMLAFIIAVITTIWGFISICVAWKPALEIFSIWIPVKYLAWICATGMRVLSFNINARDDLSMLLLYLLIYVSDACEASKPMLKRFSLWTPVPYLAWICDTVMGALMFKIANMFSQESIKHYLVRNMFDQNISELLHKSSTTWVGDPTTPNTTRGGPSDKKTHVEAPLQAQKLLTPTSSSISKPPFYKERRKYVDKLPEMYRTFIDDVQDVDGDGNCGFRAVAVGLGHLNKNEWLTIRSNLLQELEKHLEDYERMFGNQYDIVKNRLDFSKIDQVAPEEKWMQMPEIGVLIASHFEVILHVITNSGSQTYLPLYSCPPSWDRLNFISLGFVNGNHYVNISLRKGYPVPTVVELCSESEWMPPYQEWINKREY